MALQLFDNKVIENKITDIVNSALDVRSLMTVDTSLETAAGLTKVINKYTYAGVVEQLAKGAKNTQKGAVTLSPDTYTVKRYQQTYEYNDMDVMQDPFVLDVLADGAGKTMANEIRAEYFAECAKIANLATVTGTLTYDAVVDAAASLDDAAEQDVEGLFLIMGADGRAEIRKDEGFKAARQGEILFTGQFGDINGIPCIYSNLCPAKTAYLTNKEAVKFFVKKEGSVEQDRDIETKDNTVVYERHGVMALVNDTRSIKIAFTPAQSTVAVSKTMSATTSSTDTH